MSSRPEPLPRTAYKVFRHITTRWSDNDVFGHANNVVYYAWFDTAVTGWLIGNVALDPVASAVIPVVVETHCTYFASAGFPDDIYVGISLERLGRSSVTFKIGVFRNEEEAPAAQGRFTHVYVERKSNTPIPIPDQVRTALGALAD